MWDEEKALKGLAWPSSASEVTKLALELGGTDVQRVEG